MASCNAHCQAGLVKAGEIKSRFEFRGENSKAHKKRQNKNGDLAQLSFFTEGREYPSIPFGIDVGAVDAPHGIPRGMCSVFP